MKSSQHKGARKNTPQQQPVKKQSPGKGKQMPVQQTPDKQNIPDEIPGREIKRTPANPQDRNQGK